MAHAIQAIRLGIAVKANHLSKITLLGRGLADAQCSGDGMSKHRCANPSRLVLLKQSNAHNYEHSDDAFIPAPNAACRVLSFERRETV
jgi:hypothetical protein